MFEEKVVEKLSSKIEELITKFDALKNENELLRQELVRVKAQSEAKDAQIAKLEEDLKAKDMEADDILSKIEEVLNR